MTFPTGPGDAGGETPLDEDEAADLVPSRVQTQGELNELEQANIAEAVRWLSGRRRSVKRVLSERFLRDLHRRMLGETWTWAGEYRRSQKNIGVSWSMIGVAMRDLLADTEHQVAQGVLSADEIAARFHHRLVLIHPFVNGNGRHSRLMADELLKSLGRPPFTWGGTAGGSEEETRDAYLRALRAADDGDLGPLIAFVRS